MAKTSLAGKLSATSANRVTQILTTGVSARVFELVDERTELHAKIKALQEDLKAIDDRLAREADKHDGEIKTEDWSLKKIIGTNRSINKEALLQAGVKPSVIAKCTVETEYSYVRIFPKEKGK